MESTNGQGGSALDALDRELDIAWRELTAVGARYEVAGLTVRGHNLRHFVNAPRTVREFWLATTEFGDKDYLVFGEERITYAQAHRLTASVAAWLRARGVLPGERVAIAMRNYPEWMLIYWACVSTGVVVVGMNTWWAPEEMSHALRDSFPKVVFCDSERLAQSAQWSAPTTVLVAVRTAVGQAEEKGAVAWSEVVAKAAELPASDSDPDDDACIFYTSGTTGLAKGAQLTHRGCVTTYMNLSFVSEVHTIADARARLDADGAAAAIAAPRNTPVGLVGLPLFHVTANNCLAYSVTAVGGKLVLMRKWDTDEALRLIEAERVTNVTGVPTMVRDLLRHKSATNHDLSSLLVLSGGGAPMPPDMVGRVNELGQGVLPTTGYGLTETCGAITATMGAFYMARPQSCGRLLPAVEAKLIDDDGNVLPPGATGELCIKGAGVIKGYINRPDATAHAIVAGWLHTGDVARIDEQRYVYILDRKKDMVLRGGENVYCAEVEAALYRHEPVIEACVFGVPDERLGEEVAAVVVLAGITSLSEVELRRKVSALIAQHKVPRHLWMRTELLPRNANGKILRRELRDAFLKSHPSALPSADTQASTRHSS